MSSARVLVLAVVLVGFLVSAVSAEPPRYSSRSRSYPAYTSSRNRIVFGEPYTSKDDDFDKAPGIPIFLAEALNKAEDIKDIESLVDRPSLMRYEVNQNMARNADPLATRFGGGSEQSASGNRNGEMARAAICQPELTTVPVKEEKSPNAIYWPSCTRIERCGGCCSHELLSCKPTASKTIHVQVIAAQYEGGSGAGIRYTGTEMVPLEVHTACECGCKLGAQDCNSFQEYVPSECRCKCINKDDYVKCTQNELKLWEPSTCRCKCKTERECSTGHYFDLNICSCRPVPSREGRPFDPVLANRFYTSFRNFYNADNSALDPQGPSARHADPADIAARTARTEPSEPTTRRTVRVRGGQRSDRYDNRAQRH